MSKWFGKIGYAETLETEPSVYEETMKERDYYGDLVRNTRRFDLGDQVNGETTVSNQLSILADPFAQEHFYAMRYATLYGPHTGKAGGLWSPLTRTGMGGHPR